MKTRPEFEPPAIFIGHFSPFKPICSIADSPAGNQVNRKINVCLSNQYDGKSFCVSMATAAAFPKGSLIIKGGAENGIQFIGYINLAIIKHIIFSIKLFYILLKSKPKLCIQYNSFLFENIVLYLYKRLIKDVFIATILQDITISNGNKKGMSAKLRELIEYAGLGVLRKFNLIVPVSKKVIDDFKLSKSNFFIFIGGITFFAEELMKLDSKLSDFAVYAGKLERYNGFDRLIKAWTNQNIDKYLHIFGKGSLESEIIELSKINKYVIFHGQHSEKNIIEWQSRAQWNFCLRYSEGIDQDYFFPSKLFNICCARGAVIVNNFNGIPEDLGCHISIVDNDLAKLSEVLELTKDNESLGSSCQERHSIVLDRYSWEACIRKILEYSKSVSRS
jgi:glycosyltransferase involved in cell wall biosynthesis